MCAIHLTDLLPFSSNNIYLTNQTFIKTQKILAIEKQARLIFICLTCKTICLLFSLQYANCKHKMLPFVFFLNFPYNMLNCKHKCYLLFLFLNILVYYSLIYSKCKKKSRGEISQVFFLIFAVIVSSSRIFQGGNHTITQIRRPISLNSVNCNNLANPPMKITTFAIYTASFLRQYIKKIAKFLHDFAYVKFSSCFRNIVFQEILGY